MAAVTVLFSIYYFFASIVGLIRFLQWAKGEKTVGYAVSVSEPQGRYSFGSGQQRQYTYEIIAKDGDYALPCKYVEKTGKDAEPGLALNAATEMVVLKDAGKAVLLTDYEKMKKKLYLNPLACVGCIAATVLLIIIAGSI